MTAINTGRMVADLQRMIRQPSVSATGQGITECARLVSSILEDSGIGARLLEVPGHAPLVYGEARSESSPDRTILFYNHYDVQPAEPVEMWGHPPFAGEIDGGRVYGRGATDDKGELAARIEAVRTLLKSGDLPCNIKFVIEGEEENGSTGIPAYLERYGQMMACDGIVWEFGYVDASDRPIIGLGVKGMLFVELRARGASRDLHSGMAPIIQNAAWRLTGALSTLAGSDGRIRVPGWYDGAEPLSEDDRRLLKMMPYDAESVKSDTGVERFVLDQDGAQAKEDLAGVATCNIAGLWSGYTGNGTKTVLPSEATAKLDLRILPGMNTGALASRLRGHLADNGYGDIEVTILHAEPGSRTSPAHPFVGTVREAADAAYGTHILSIIYPETGPLWHFASKLGAPCVLAGGTHVHSRMHAPDEWARVDLLEKTSRMMVSVLEGFGR